MSIFKFNLVKMAIFVLTIGLFTSMKTEMVKADVAIKGPTQVVLRSATFKTDKVIKVPDRSAQKKKKEVEKRLSRGETSTNSLVSGSKSDLISYAYDFIGKPYVWGATGPKSFDCSGFTKYVYNAFGVDLPHYTGAQIGEGSSVSRDSLKQGDLIFFNTDGPVSHVGIYVGNGEFIHASSGSRKVTVSNLGQSYYATRYAGARRILN
ncbi:C40 family peptidase [Clostridium estertheticum]|uniref:C40 family peptidase n=1 Tax=Clostridium estertheticum TaxID=238834 RepID=UPI0013E97AC0|nr:C40 family peptidase [Clostridium estertheticum]MBZ9688251.1 C40 family peptidase [Clostridium estertheticum]